MIISVIVLYWIQICGLGVSPSLNRGPDPSILLDLVFSVVRFNPFQFQTSLSPRGFNLMNLSTEPVQLVLSHMYITSFDASFMFGCACSRYSFLTHVFDSDLSIHMCLSLHTT